MLHHNRGCYIRVGNGEGEGCARIVHNSNYNFNDDVLFAERAIKQPSWNRNLGVRNVR